MITEIFKLSTNIQCEKNNQSAFLIFPKICKKIDKKLYSDIFWASKSKLQIILVLVVTYIALFLPDSNNCFLDRRQPGSKKSVLLIISWLVCWLAGCFLRNGSRDFSDFLHEVRGLYR